MGQDPYPWATLKKRPLWQCFNPFEAANNMLRNPGHHLVTERWVFGARVNPLKPQQTITAVPGAVPSSGRQLDTAFSRPPAHITSADVHATGGRPAPPPRERQFLIFDQSGNRTTVIFSSVSPALQAHGDTNDLVGEKKVDVVNLSDETTYVSKGSKLEETDDIDALLYSDSEEEEVNATAVPPSTASPNGEKKVNVVVVVEEEVASSGGPSKRRRLDDGNMDDEALMDTASSVTDKADNVHMATTATCCEDHTSTCKGNGDDNNDQSSCIKGASSCSSPKWAATGMVAADQERNDQQPAVSKAGGSSSTSSMWKVKRDQICETVSILRGIIPGCKGKDACLVLDEAIRYLKSLELKVQSLGGGVI